MHRLKYFTFLPLHLILLLAWPTLCITGCRTRRLTYPQHEAGLVDQAPQWIFGDKKIGLFNGRFTLQAIGIDSRALNYRSRRQNAILDAERKLKNSIKDVCMKLAQEKMALKEIKYIEKDIYLEYAENAAENTVGLINDEFMKSNIHESLLRREVFVKLFISFEDVYFTFSDQLIRRIEAYKSELSNEHESESRF